MTPRHPAPATPAPAPRHVGRESTPEHPDALATRHVARHRRPGL